MQYNQTDFSKSHSFSSSIGVRDILPLVIAVALLGACSTSPHGRSQLTTPAPVTDMYSEVDMRLELVTSTSIKPCSEEECSSNEDFDRQVQQMGARLAQSAFDNYPDLAERVSRFEFVIAEKEEFGSTSNASGTIVIFRGVQKRHLDEEAMALLLAREMGHVIGRHHAENAAPRIMLSILTAVLFPALNILRASTPTSFIGSKLILKSLKPGQLREADNIALKLLGSQEWTNRSVIGGVDSSNKIEVADAWSKPSPSLM